jgi:invasion protein IalB
MRSFAALRLLVLGTPLVALCAAPAATAADSAAGRAGQRGEPIRLAQQGKAAPKAAAPAPAANAPAPAGQGDEPAAWAVTCTDQGQKKFTCEMTQALIDQKTNNQVMFLSIRNTATGESKALLVRLFHGVYLPTGVSIKVDGGQPTAVAFQKSDRFGVYAALPLTDKIVAEMKRGTELKFSLQINQGEPLDLIARLNGFGPAYDRLSSMN